MSSQLVLLPKRPSAGRWAFADVAGLTASIGCAIHCAAMPLVFAYLPAFGLGWMAEEGFHRYMAVLCFALALAAFLPGWRSHRSWVPMLWGITGLILLNAAAFGLEGSCCPSNHGKEVVCQSAACTECSECEIDEKSTQPAVGALSGITPFVTPFGGLLLVIGHISNHRKRCCCSGDRCCQQADGPETDQELAAH